MKYHDTAIFDLIKQEEVRQAQGLEMIASENFVSDAVRQAQGSVLTHKYAEGYPGKRYYGGCGYVDQIETLAVERACKLFGAQYANVQPHSGSQANQAVFLALLSPGQTILSMNLSAGGHLTHGAPINMSGKWFRVIHYGVDPITHRIDYDQVHAMALEHRPHMIIAGASSYARTIDFSRFRQTADAVGAYLLCDIAHIAGLIAADAHPSCIPHAHVTTTTTHKTLRGPRGGMILCNDNVIAQKIDKAVFPGIQGGPLMHVIAAKAVCFYEALCPKFHEYARAVVHNAFVLAEALKERGFSLISGGTDNHLILVNLEHEDLSGKEAQNLLEEAGIRCNKNAIPEDPRSVVQTSGIRLGTPALTTRGMGPDVMIHIATWIDDLIHHKVSPQNIRKDVLELCAAYPIPSSFISS